MAKKVASFTVEEKVLAEFDKYCKDNAINKSAMVEKLVQQFLKSK
jgi:metal-responsive CopG/Arc/MetJ family transcriptional regulator